MSDHDILSLCSDVMRWIGERIAAYELSQNHETK
jgi:hypothetical protein